MRPEVSDELVEQIEEVGTKNGYQSTGEFVRDSVRRRIEELRASPLININQPSDSTDFEFGIDVMSEQPITYDLFNPTNNANMLVFGDTSHSVDDRRSNLFQQANTNGVEVIVIDTDDKYSDVCSAVNGEHVVVGSDIGLNPLEIQEIPDSVLKQDNVHLDPYTEKVERVLLFLETLLRVRNMELGDGRAILEKAIHSSYQQKGITRDPETHGKESPTMSDMVNTLQNMAENPEEYSFLHSELETANIKQGASHILIALQQFRHGKEFENLSHQTEIDINNSSSFTYIEVQTQERYGGMGLTMQLLFNMVYEYSKTTQNNVVFVIDDSRHVMTNGMNIDFLVQPTRHSRHYDLSIQLITSSVNDFFTHDLSHEVARNCSIKQFNTVEKFDEKTALDDLKLDRTQFEYVKNAQVRASNSTQSILILNNKTCIIDSSSHVPT